VAEVKAAEQPKKEEKKPVAAAKAPEKKPANKPVVNRTVRVDGKTGFPDESGK